jgi:predicted Zn-dependent protease
MVSRVPRLRLAIVCTSALLFACGTLSVEEEKKLGTQAQRAVRQEFQMVRDHVVVNVVEDEAINAFALPGGAIYVHTGTIQKAADASELAGVVAHEIAHVTERHVAHLYRRQRNTGVAAQAFTILVAILTGNPYIANAASLGTQVAATAYLSTFTREAESESDAVAVETLIAAGYDPEGMLTFFDTLRKETAGGMRPPQFLSSHPATEERIADVRRMIQQHLPLPPGLRRDDGGKLEIIQKRIDLVIGTDPGES